MPKKQSKTVEDLEKDLKKAEKELGIEDKTDEISMSDILNNAKKTKNAFEEGFSYISKKLFNRDDLYMISRLNTEMTYYIVKQIIVESVFFQYWIKRKVEFTFSETKEYPFYKINVNEQEDKTMNEYVAKVFKDMIFDILALTISHEGKGRTEGLAIIDSAKQKLMELEAMQNMGTMNKFIQ